MWRCISPGPMPAMSRTSSTTSCTLTSSNTCTDNPRCRSSAPTVDPWLPHESAVAQTTLHPRNPFFQQRPWAAEVQAHELLGVIAEIQPGAQPDSGLFEEELLRVVQPQCRAIEPRQISALGNVHGHARQPRANGL